VSSYIRGAGGVEVRGGTVARVIVGICLTALAILVILVSLETVRQHSRYSRLQRSGVAVDVTVTGCLGLASGTGITVAGYTCKGTFLLDGHRYTDVIGGTSQLYQPGQRIRAVADPARPAVLATPESVARTHWSWTAFVTPVGLLVLLALLVALAGWRFRRAGRVVSPPTSGDSGS
jgi:hypothetical protein